MTDDPIPYALRRDIDRNIGALEAATEQLVSAQERVTTLAGQLAAKLELAALRAAGQ